MNHKRLFGFRDVFNEGYKAKIAMNHQRLLALEMCSMKATRQQNCNESPEVLGFRDVITEATMQKSCHAPQ